MAAQVTRIFIKGSTVRANAASGEFTPPIVVTRGKKRAYGTRVRIDGPAELIYDSAKVRDGEESFIVTTSPVIVDGRPFDVAAAAKK